MTVATRPKRKPINHWADRFRSSQGRFASAYWRIGPLSFHLSLAPYEGWKYRIATPIADVDVWLG